MKGSKWFRFNPNKEILVVLLSWLLVVSVFYISFQVITTKRVAAQFITFAVIGIMLCGIFAPVAWNSFVMKRSMAEIGIGKKRLAISVLLCIIFTAVQYILTLKNAQIPAIVGLIPLVSMVLTVGFFENVFFRGWVQLRMETYFGIIPGIILSALIYSLYHIGYGMQPGEIEFLFFIGLVYSILFRLTKNIFILFPFLTPSGALYTLIKDGLELPLEATLGFADVIIVIIAGLIFINRISLKKQSLAVPRAYEKG